jgi:hypothetical protein
VEALGWTAKDLFGLIAVPEHAKPTCSSHNPYGRGRKKKALRCSHRNENPPEHEGGGIVSCTPFSAFNLFHRYRLRVTRASFAPSGVAARPDPSGEGAR